MENKYEYLDLLDKKLDESQRKVCCSNINTIVAAGAGSGKTQTLATRFAWLIMENENISASEILTLTFTKKAAAEMYARIYKNLGKFASNKNTPQPQRDRAQKALDEFANVHIQTLDSYCSGVLRQSANRYGIRPDFTTGSADSISNIKEKALPFILAHRNDPAIICFSKPGELQNFSNDFFAKIIIENTSLATKSGFFEDSLKKQKNQLCQALNYLLGNSESNCTDEEILSCTPYNKIIYNLKQEYKNECRENKKAVTEELEAANAFFDSLDEKSLWAPVYPKDFDINLDNLKIKMKKISSIIAAYRNIAIKRSWEQELKNLIIMARGKNDDPVDLAGTAIFLSSIESYISNYMEIKRLFELLDEFLVEVNNNKRSSGSLTFKDVSEMALRTLIEQNDIRRQECNAYKKIMIDEFQDNNSANRDLLFLLSIDPKKEFPLPTDDKSDSLRKALLQMIQSDKLFFVGDEKQSIYKFRGADVGVFNQLKTDLVNLNGPKAFLHMTNNYRSKPELVSSFNHIFGGFKTENGNLVQIQDIQKNDEETFIFSSIFKKNLETNELYEAGYPQDACATKPDFSNGKTLPHVSITKENCKSHIAIFIETNELSKEIDINNIMDSKDTQAFYIASKIKEIHDANPDENYSNFAILEKSRTNRAYLTKWLDIFHIPYSMDQQAKIFSEGPVNDIYNFLRLCVYPSDATAFASYIHSPFVGLSHVSMETVLACESFFDDSAELQIKENLSSEEFNKYLKGKDFFLNQQQKTLARPLTQTLDVLWYNSGYRFETMLNSHLLTFSEHYDLLFEIARTSDQTGKDIGWFIDQLSQIKANETRATVEENTELNAKEIDYPLEKSDGVQILTIHKSKGLEYDHVFIWGISGGPNNEKENLFFFDETNGVSIKNPDGTTNFFFRKQASLAKKKSLAEFRRLIYVACTRAVKDFYIVGTTKISGESDSKKEISLFGFNEEKLILNLLEVYYPKFYLNDENKGNSVTEDKIIDFNNDAPFDFILIGAKPKKLLWSMNDSQKRDVSFDYFREKLCKKKSVAYENAKIIETPEIQLKKLSPSSLEKLMPPKCPKNLIFEDAPANDYSEINRIIEKKSNIQKESDIPEDVVYKFSYADFGTLVHFVMECFVTDTKCQEEDLKPFLKNLEENDQKVIILLSKQMAEDFSKTKAASALFSCKKRGGLIRTEWAYRTSIDGWLFSGSLDLLFQNEDGSYSIIDYKTDMNIKPEIYFYQQTCYRKAAADLLGIQTENIRCYLHYLRFNKTIDITEQANQNLNSKLFETLSASNCNEHENLLED